ncbi:MAG: D-glycero-beta-D-manno-heptose 1-phosphate adenylyltransferase [Bacteriovoracia bacterium]
MRALQKKILPVTRLARITAAAKKRGKRVVFTNGCFDILHKGHVRYLERARAQGDLLVVALNADQSVRKLKGAGRPINPLRDRQEVMAALEAVDYVTSFAEATPLRAILTLKPMVLVKGGDWKANDIVGGREVLGWGGQVKSLNFVKGRSTTRIIKKIAG